MLATCHATHQRSAAGSTWHSTHYCRSRAFPHHLFLLHMQSATTFRMEQYRHGDTHSHSHTFGWPLQLSRVAAYLDMYKSRNLRSIAAMPPYIRPVEGVSVCQSCRQQQQNPFWSTLLCDKAVRIPPASDQYSHGELAMIMCNNQPVITTTTTTSHPTPHSSRAASHAKAAFIGGTGGDGTDANNTRPSSNTARYIHCYFGCRIVCH